MLHGFREIEWFLVDGETVDIWHPQIYISNSVKTQNIVSFARGVDAISSLWYSSTNNYLYYSTIFSTTISCDLNFQTFPFDSHECILVLKNFLTASWRVTLMTPKLYTIDKDNNEVEGAELKMIGNDRLDYNFEIKGFPLMM